MKRKYKVKEKREQKKKFKKKRTVPNVVPKPLPPAPPPAAPPVIQKPNEVEPMIEQGTTADIKRYSGNFKSEIALTLQSLRTIQ